MRKGLRILQFSFTDTNLTHFGGMVLIQRFCNKLGLRRLLQRYVRIPHRNVDYQSADLILALLYAMIAGLRRINKTDILQYNGTFLSLLGLDCFPDQSTLRRFLKRLSPQFIRRLVALHNRLRSQLFFLPSARTSLIFDLDSVVLTIYGKQQFARVGYNPKKRGRRSYHPLLCFEAQQQEFWHGSLRPGDAASNTGAVPFLRRCLDKVPTSIARSRIRVRADAGFFGHRLVEFLDSTGLKYVVVARAYRTIRARAQACKFRSLHWGWQVGEFHYKPTHWQRVHRFIVVRRPIPEDPVEAKQLKRFKDRRYSYSIFVTNLELDPWRVWRFYSPRATIEKNIRELLYDFPLSKIPTDDWIANVAFFQLLLFAYDLVHWFKRLCLPPEYLRATLDTVRTDFLVLPAKLVQAGHRNVLQLPKDYHYREQFVAAWERIGKLRLPKKF
jgi:hypothetical protein